MVNPHGADPGSETVTILNISAQALDLTGWSILDKHDKSDAIGSGASGPLAPGAAMVVPLSGHGAQLSNDGGTITLLDPRGLKVDGVAYTKAAAKIQGQPVIFI